MKEPPEFRHTLALEVPTAPEPRRLVLAAGHPTLGTEGGS